LVHTKGFKNGICCFCCFNAQHLRFAQRIKKQSVDYTSAKVKLIQSWRYKTLAVIERHKTTLSFYHIAGEKQMYIAYNPINVWAINIICS